MNTIEGLKKYGLIGDYKPPEPPKLPEVARPPGFPDLPVLGFRHYDEAVKAGIEQSLMERIRREFGDNGGAWMEQERAKLAKVFKDMGLKECRCPSWRADLASSKGRCGATAYYLNGEKTMISCLSCKYTGEMFKVAYS
jgi:hypothetical protein